MLLRTVTKMLGVKVLLGFLTFLSCSRDGAYGQTTFDLQPFQSPQTNNSLQVDSQGKAYVLSGSQLLRLSRDLQLEQNVSLPDLGATLSLSPDDQRLLVCVNGMMSRSCFIYDPSDLTTQPVTTGVSIVGAGTATATSFSTEGSFYVGSYVVMGGGSSVVGMMRLSHYIYGDGSGTPVIRSSDFDALVTSFVRIMLFGFVKDMYAYFVVVDPGPAEVAGFRVLRVCHVTSCAASPSPCSIGGLYEQTIQCGNRISRRGGDDLCGATLVDNFGAVPGPSLVVSRCRQDRDDDNNVCLFNLTAIDANMDLRYDECSMGIGETHPAWQEDIGCRPPDFDNGRCNFSPILDDITMDSGVSAVSVIFSTEFINFGDGVGTDSGNRITSSLAIQVDDISIVVVAYSFSMTSFFVGFFATDGRSSLDFNNAFKTDSVLSLSRAIDWQNDMDHVYAISNISVTLVPLEECSMYRNCSSCVSDRNPLCGWCVVENKCSRISQCANGNSTSDRWIRANSTTSSSGRCIVNVITPSQFIMDNPQILSVSVGGPGLPVLLPGESYSCHLADSEERYNVTVPAIAVVEGSNYTCNITGSNFNYVGVASVVDFSFASSITMVPFDTSINALTVYRCNAATRCSDCLQTENACGWCAVNKICRGTTLDCTTSTTSTFLQLVGSQTFEDVCPLLLNNNERYTQHVRVGTDLQLTTSNLPSTEPEFSYYCLIGGNRVAATRNNESSVTCNVDNNQVLLTSSAMSTEVVGVGIIWTNGGSFDHRIDTLASVNVTLYDCMPMATDCSACINTRIGTGFQCGWCDANTATCSVSEECAGGTSFVNTGAQCPAPSITMIQPQTGPPQGGTNITITGRNLGVTFSDFTANSITLTSGSNSVQCTPISDGYMSGSEVRCTMNVVQDGSYTLAINIPSGMGTYNDGTFVVSLPTVTGATPLQGPIAGGTTVTITGTDLNIGNKAVVGFTGITERCTVMDRTASTITCDTMKVNMSSPGDLIVLIDAQTISIDTPLTFDFKDNPTFTSVSPQRTILSGGVMLTFLGTNLDVAQNPQLAFSNMAVSDCLAVNSTVLVCEAPAVPAGTTSISYTLRLDNAPSPNTTSSSPLALEAVPDPEVTDFDPKSIPRSTLEASSNTLLTVEGKNFMSVERNEINITIGGFICSINRLDATNIDCRVPTELRTTESAEVEVMVTIGSNLTKTFNEHLQLPTASNNTMLIIIVVVVVVVVLLLLGCFLIAVIVCLSRKQQKKKERQYTNLIAKMELLEVEMADECKRAFTELQTDLADLVQISDKNLPYRDFRTFAMRFLFPKAGLDHPVLCPLSPEGIKMDEEEVVKHLHNFHQLLLDKKFLLVFIRSLEAEGSFTLQDKCDVASLLMVIFQNDLDYATDILQTLLAELMRKTIAKSHPKLLLRRTETVGEKMLANWLAFLLFPYILEHVGEPLFILFRAIKSQLEKGPVDVVTGEAKNSLSEEKLLRQHMEVKPVEGLVHHEDEEVPIKLWHCDSITQAKEKILDILYRNTPVSKRPQLNQIDLELISTGANGIILRDQDATNKREGEWVKVNTLGHFNLDEMSKLHDDNPKNPVPRFRIVSRPQTAMSDNYDTLGTIIANVCAADRNLRNMSASELSSLFHLVKPETDDPEGSGGTKIMSEVFLTRLLSTKRILQPYVDRLFQAIFAVPHGRALPKAIKSLFDFLDLQASELGISDSEVLHAWKTNSVPLRFWVNVIKNPDFLFDINKSATVDSCLTVIAQAYIDATSTADIRYTKDTPSARLLYVNEVKEYKASVNTYYNTIQSMPKLSNSEMAEYLRETAQVCADSIAQDGKELEACNLKPDNDDPASTTRKLYFVTESALFELFKFASRYSSEIIDALNEEGLALLATSFDQMRKNLS